MMNADHNGSYYFWLAEQTFQALFHVAAEGPAKPPIPSGWKSSSIGKTVEDVPMYIATSPIDKRLDKQIIAVLDGRLFKKEDWLVIHRIDEQGEISSNPCKAQSTSNWLHGYQDHNWPMYV